MLAMMIVSEERSGTRPTTFCKKDKLAGELTNQTNSTRTSDYKCFML